jgi:DNA topoisomerase-6 subunit B
MAKSASKKQTPSRKKVHAAKGAGRSKPPSAKAPPGRGPGKNVAAPGPATRQDKTPASKTEAQAAPAARPKVAYATAESMAKDQRAISVSEFFAKNRHLLGFDNPRKALLTTVKEAVDNSLDACEEAGILPVVEIGIEQLSETYFRVRVLDNGPGIVKKQIPSIFGRLLYGSKFHRLRMSRGQQGIGISAAGMYGLLTTGQPVKVTSRTSGRAKAHYYEIQIDTRSNTPDVISDQEVDWDVAHGTRVEIELEARYQRGRQSVDDYLAQTAIANPHVTLVYHAPDGRNDTYQATTKTPPPLPKSIRPHPYGIELGVLIKMLADSKARTVQKFLTGEFSRVSSRVASEILQKASLNPKARPSQLNGEAAKAIYQAIQQTKIMAPATDCVVPIGEDKLIESLKQVIDAEFYTATTRSPAVYRGNPFIIETAIAYGQKEKTEADRQPAGQREDQQQPPPAKGEDDDETPAVKLIRFANRVPLLYEQSACAIYKAVAGLNWKPYGLVQSKGSLPCGPLTVVVHMASVWVPYTSESKEAIASYPEIMKEIRLSLQECGRRLGSHVRKTIRIRQELKKRSYIEQYIPAIGEALRDILDLKEKHVAAVCRNLKNILEHSRRL